MGLKRVVMRYVISEAAPVDVKHWQKNERMYIQPIMAPWQNLQTRNARSRMWGTCAALHIAYLHLAPIPISPFLIYCLVRPTLDCPLDFIRFVDPKAAELLKPWYDLEYTDPLPTDPASPIVQMFTEATGLDVRCFSQFSMSPLSSFSRRNIYRLTAQKRPIKAT